MEKGYKRKPFSGRLMSFNPKKILAQSWTMRPLHTHKNKVGRVLMVEEGPSMPAPILAEVAVLCVIFVG
jgi:hypothetical protein